MISQLERIPTRYFEHITGSNGLYEIRVEVGSNIYRVFSFFDKEKLSKIIEWQKQIGDNEYCVYRPRRNNAS